MEFRWLDGNMSVAPERGSYGKDLIKPLGRVAPVPFVEDEFIASSPFADEHPTFESEEEAKYWCEQQFVRVITLLGLEFKTEKKLPKGRNSISVEVDTEGRYKAGEMVLVRAFLRSSPGPFDNNLFTAVSAAKSIERYPGRDSDYKLKPEDIVGKIAERQTYDIGDEVMRHGELHIVEGWYGEEGVAIKNISSGRSPGEFPTIVHKFDVFKAPPKPPEKK